MTYMYLPSMPMPDANQMSFSMWFRIPTVGGFAFNNRQYLLMFGADGADDLLNVSGLEVKDVGGGNWKFTFTVWGGIINPSPPPAVDSIFNRYQSESIALTRDVWHHIAIGYDGSGTPPFPEFGYTLSSTPVFKVMIDGVNRPQQLTSHSPWDTLPADVFIDSVFYDIDRASSGMYVNGFKFGVPSLGAQIASSSIPSYEVKFAYYLVWFNKYIDWTNTTNFNKVVVDKGAGGRVPPDRGEAAVAAFGTPNFWFYRDKKRKVSFQTNKGSAGSMSVIGTAPSDFKPGP